jgi:hypothetical protein
MNRCVPTVFFSWQSDRPTKEGRNLIETALKTALKRIAQDIGLEEPLRNLALDKDTQGVPGSPPIFDTILEKIDRTAVFVPDLTFVAQRQNGDPIPNANVLIEYGYALKTIGHHRIVAVMNTAHGKPKRDTMPFDLAHHIFPITYDLFEGAPDDERHAQRDQLAKTLESAIRTVLNSEKYKASLPKPEPLPAVKYREPQQGRARFWAKDDPVGYVYDPLNTFQGGEDVPVKIATSDAIWLRLMPERPITQLFPIAELKKLIPPLTQTPLYTAYSNTLPFRGAEGAGLCTPLIEEPSPALVFVFTDAEIWTLDTFRFKRLAKILSLDEKGLSDTLNIFAKFLDETLKVPPPYRWVVGVEGVKGRSLPKRDHGLQGPCMTDVIEFNGIFARGDDAAAALEPFFAKVFELCGATRHPRP